MEVLKEVDRTLITNRVCTIRTSAEVLVLVLGVEPEPNLMVVL